MNSTTGVTFIVPDRYEGLSQNAGDELAQVIEQVPESLEALDATVASMSMSARGAFWILRGDSGSGKSTFVHTVPFYRDHVRVIDVDPGQDLRKYFAQQDTNGIELTIFVLEEREAETSFSDPELETWLHSINGFIRSQRGRKALIVWPCNTDELRDRIVRLGRALGATALLPNKDGYIPFQGPPPRSYPSIAERTFSVLNQGATLTDLGLSDDELRREAETTSTIGLYLHNLQQQILSSKSEVTKLLQKEQYRLWIVVVAGNDPVSEVGGLTRSSLSWVDSDRLMNATGANIVKQIKQTPKRAGLLATSLGAKILYLPLLTATTVVRAYADERLEGHLRTAGFSLSPKDQKEAKRRLCESEFGKMLTGGTQGTLTRGQKPGSKSIESFERIVKVTRERDALVNAAIGRALNDAKLVSSFRTERSFGEKTTQRTDLVIETTSGTIRVEMMWRSKVGRADIANYVLQKLAAYGRAIGYF